MTPGNTPLVEVDGIFAKLECTNPLGSVKDRIAKYIIDNSEKLGILKPGMTIVEASSGNTGIAMSYYAKLKGYKCVIVMPENMTEERKNIIKGNGAELILCSAGDFAEAAGIRNKMAEDASFFNPDQFSNPLNVDCHYHTTAIELLEQMKPFSDSIDAFVAGVGTGGTLIGIGKKLKEINSDFYVAAVEPSESAVMNGKPAGLHQIQGIGDGFIPAIASDGNGGLHSIINEAMEISSAEAIKAASYLENDHHICVGVSSGANYLAAQKLKSRFKTVATVFSDGYSKYQSFDLKHCVSGKCVFEANHTHLLSENKSLCE